MPKLNERERLADLEARQRKMTAEIEDARRAVRSRYAAIATDLPVETISEREFRDLLTAAIRVGGSASLAALKPLPSVPAWS